MPCWEQGQHRRMPEAGGGKPQGWPEREGLGRGLRPCSKPRTAFHREGDAVSSRLHHLVPPRRTSPRCKAKSPSQIRIFPTIFLLDCGDHFCYAAPLINDAFSKVRIE